MLNKKTPPHSTRCYSKRAPDAVRPSYAGMFLNILLLLVFTNSVLALPVGNSSRWSEQAVAGCGVIPKTLNVAANQWSQDVVKVSIRADNIEYPDRSIAHLRGYVELVRGSYRVFSDEMIYNKAEAGVVAKGSVKLQSSEGDVIFTPILRYFVATGKAVSGFSRFIIANRKSEYSSLNTNTIDSYGTASRITLVAENVMYLENATVTSCQDGKEYTVFSASELRVDLDEGMRTAKHVKIRIMSPDRHDRIRDMAK